MNRNEFNVPSNLLRLAQHVVQLAELDQSEYTAVLDVLRNRKGEIIFTGVGKSGAIAAKCAATANSNRLRSLFMDCTNGLHGDLGRVSKDDVVIALSKSGSSEELSSFLQGCPADHRILITEAKGSPCEAAATLVVRLPKSTEICSIGLSPTTSTLAQLAFLDCLIVQLSYEEGLSKEDFASGHPGGKLGRLHKYRVGDIMRKASDLPYWHGLSSIDIMMEMTKHHCGYCFVYLDGNIGLVTDGDIRRARVSNPDHELNHMRRDQVCWSPKQVSPYAMLDEALAYMGDLSMLVVAEGPLDQTHTLLGVITKNQILEFLK